MGKGINLASEDNPLHAVVIDDLKDQLLIVFLKRLGGSVTIPVAEVDDTGNDMLEFAIRDMQFIFNIRRKS